MIQITNSSPIKEWPEARGSEGATTGLWAKVLASMDLIDLPSFGMMDAVEADVSSDLARPGQEIDTTRTNVTLLIVV